MHLSTEIIICSICRQSESDFESFMCDVIMSGGIRLFAEKNMNEFSADVVLIVDQKGWLKPLIITLL